MKVLGQPWLLDEANPYVTTVSQSIENISVNSLMCMDRRCWDSEVIRDIFNDRDQGCIWEVPIGHASDTDTLFWKFE